MNNLYRIHPQPAFNFNGLVIDNFAGGGGASTGIELGLGRPVDIAVNHDPEAVAMHGINHPHTRHYCESVHAEGFTIIAGDNKRLVACTTSKLLPPRSKSTGTAAAPTAEQLSLFSNSGAAA